MVGVECMGDTYIDEECMHASDVHELILVL